MQFYWGKSYQEENTKGAKKFSFTTLAGLFLSPNQKSCISLNWKSSSYSLIRIKGKGTKRQKILCRYRPTVYAWSICFYVANQNPVQINCWTEETFHRKIFCQYVCLSYGLDFKWSTIKITLTILYFILQRRFRGEPKVCYKCRCMEKKTTGQTTTKYADPRL